MNTTRVGFLIALLALAAPAGAQQAARPRETHPCDAAIPSNPSVNSRTPVIGFCWPSQDVDGQPATLTSARITSDGTQVFSGPLTAIGAPSATGMSYFEATATVAIPKGNHSMVAYVSSEDGESLGSVAFPFRVQGGPPKPPTIMTVKKPVVKK